MADNVVKLYPSNSFEKADNLFDLAVGDYKDALIIGYNHEGFLEVRCTKSLSDGGDLLWLIETFKQNLLNGNYSIE